MKRPEAPGGLFDDRHELRFYDPLVGSQEPKAMDAGGGDNHPVRRISQRAAQRRNFLGDARSEGDDSEGGVCVQLVEQVIHASDDRLAPLGKQCDFEKTDGADSDALSLPDRLIENAALFPG